MYFVNRVLKILISRHQTAYLICTHTKTIVLNFLLKKIEMSFP